MSYDFIVKNGVFVTPDGRFSGALGVREGKIAALAPSLPEEGAEVFDAGGHIVLPGCVDLHVHVDDPGRSEWEDWPHATAAAAAGGITTIADMPLNSTPAVVNTEALRGKEAVASRGAYVDYVLWGGLTGENARELPAMQNAGVRPFKAFMSASGIPDFSSAGNRALLAGLEQTVGTDSFIGVHAECEDIACYLAEKLKAKGRRDPMAWVESRPVACEVEAIGRFLTLAAVSGGNGHVCHVTSVEGAKLLDAARKQGLPVTFETCASYLTFTQEDFARVGPNLKCAPPLRTAENREGLWELVKNGTIPMVTSDHSPCTPELKERGRDDIWAAWGGISSIQTTLYTMLTEGCWKRGLTLERLTEVCCSAPARRLGLEGVKGVIAPGTDADLVVIDPEAAWTLTEEALYTKNKCSPLVGTTLHGKVLATFLRGEAVYRGGIVGAPRGRNCCGTSRHRGESL